MAREKENIEMMQKALILKHRKTLTGTDRDWWQSCKLLEAAKMVYRIPFHKRLP